MLAFPLRLKQDIHVRTRLTDYLGISDNNQTILLVEKVLSDSTRPVCVKVVLGCGLLLILLVLAVRYVEPGNGLDVKALLL